MKQIIEFNDEQWTEAHRGSLEHMPKLGGPREAPSSRLLAARCHDEGCFKNLGARLPSLTFPRLGELSAAKYHSR